MEIRLGTIPEVLKIDEKIKEFDPGHISAKLDKFNVPSLIVLIASENGIDIGYSISYDEFHDGSIHACYGGVLHEYRGKGVYSKLAEKRAQIAKEKGYTSIKLYTRNKRREILTYLITRGWNIMGFIPKKDLEDNRILFEKQLV
ncbi:hypothetical protein CO112_03220 [Candidatus Dojkabacteria bacterium CG_4_9_14_3_um_filter_150_Dojkabacteria_WS6_41_13]|uniref:N-acetyltransferase domain-containing protein n=1 Tax=Candidatus Dojkabacteria bacterium CG_4_10_14_0_2_um_filter_Dojkabacteria_WS6_41_15 TaxID=2014249 RepID=A0A2M7W0R4_9BACT|nr:MAG: hypothetical protein COZ14_00610 [Candidatus Dojkabacteria bacterium CG_4_10_14_3_um_filter_Dojkabacteria_WS6_41_9]PJA12276.1 MAG: hypothetical protein COX64_04890 [Candidatus Dojkabacteria bacterium CG_4_10_14_0_2_um_filter_Dojkabacteria_WS6_41_15]PJB22628.1 MAG: hypothetical protein CO112_03220 [Candidatus Dojkabacteria bacterium CG_4_9_14_3_um_filter_150_Dojkabacteria_WS6_41_13]